MSFFKTLPSHKPFLIGIDGLPGSGKSTLARTLAEAIDSVVIPLDDFTGWSPDPKWREQFVGTILNPLKMGIESLSYRPVSWWPDHHPTPITITPIPAVIIIEGIEALHPLFFPYYHQKILVTTEPRVCLTRGITRDQAQGDLDAITRLWQLTLKQASDYLIKNQLISQVDMIVDGTRPVPSETLLAQIPTGTHDISR